MKRVTYAALALALAGAGSALTAGAAEDAFFRGKTIRVLVGFSPGGGFDTYSRLIARHLGRHVPGNPAVIVENMPGAGSMIAANYLYKVAKPDGLTMGTFSGTLLLAQLLGQPGVEFDARRFEWLGMPVKANIVCALTRASNVRSLDQWAAAKTPVKIAGTGRNTQPEDAAKILKAALNLPIHLVSGYKGTSDMRLAAEKGEVDGICWDWESMRVTWKGALANGDVTVVVQATQKPLADLPKVPLASSLAKTDEARRMIEVGLQYQATFVRPYAMPPGIPRERVQALRAAFQAALKDPALLAEAAKANLDIDAVGAEEADSMIQGLFKLDPAIAARLKEVLQ